MREIRGAIFVLLVGTPVLAQLPPPPEPITNLTTEPKRVLGKILFWDEQLSSDGTIACGTCHQPAAGGSDPRVGVNPGPDGSLGTPDDILGSPGVRRVDEQGAPVDDPVFGLEVQVTGRAANTAIMAAYAPELFWDGRAEDMFTDPETGAVSIVTGGALESQAVGPILSDVEMAHEGRTWDDVRNKLAASVPLANATDLPADVEAVLATNPSYPDLFLAAFGDPTIDAERIAFAIAAYERTLIPDETPWDLFMAGDQNAMTPQQVNGWLAFEAQTCNLCHAPPTFSDHTFRNIGIRPPDEDLGRQEVTGIPPDRGRFKVPTLRNSGLKPTFMHNGQTATMLDAVRWYRPNNPLRSNDNLDPLLPIPLPGGPGGVAGDIAEFIQNGLTDPRVATESFPFDRPTLHEGALQEIEAQSDGSFLWPALGGVSAYNVYRGELSDLPDYGVCVNDLDIDPSETVFLDPTIPSAGSGFFYLKSVVDGNGAERGFGASSAGQARQPLVSCGD